MSVGGTGQPAESTEGAPRASHDTRFEAIGRALRYASLPTWNDAEQDDAIAALIAVAAELAEMRQALEQIAQWDCLNPPDANLCADHPWLKRLVDAALAGSVADEE